MKIIVNEVSTNILTEIEENGGNCPHKLDKAQDSKCMYREFLEQKIIRDCHCGLFKKVEV